MQAAKRIVIVAGEESGDLHAARLIKELKNTYSDIKISGVGGKHMSDAGAELISDLARFGVTGITEVVQHFSVIRKAFNSVKQHLKNERPDLLILVDYPGFNLRLAKYAKKKLNLKIIYYISPQIWAWKAKRIHLIKQCVDHMAVILPFEKMLYQKANIPVDFVGHPLVEEIQRERNQEACRLKCSLPRDTLILAILPGSRLNEIERHMPILRETIIALQKVYPKLHVIIPVARTIQNEKIASYLDDLTPSVTLIKDNAIECMVAADFVVVASGTASLECALLEKPMCIIYKASLLTYIIASKLINVRFLGLCNLLANKMIVPEFLQYDCNPTELSKYIISFFSDSTQPHHMQSELLALKGIMSSKSADRTLKDLVGFYLN
jgi:lipid-A-disaccharide synthase